MGKFIMVMFFASLVLLTNPAGAQTADPPGAAVGGFDFGGTGETIFEHTRASLRDPHFGMRVYRAHKVPGTLSVISDPGSADADSRAALPDGLHKFWDVAFGERAPVMGWYDVHPTRSIRHARGVQLNIDAAAFLLLDFTAQSSAVINTDYRLGASVDLRPWRDGWDLLSLSVGFFHQSTHLGDEYTLSAGTIQDSAPPAANAALPYRANPSYLAFPATLSLDLSSERVRWLTGRLYFGGTVFAQSELPQATHPEFRGGLEVRMGRPDDSSAEFVAAPPATATATGVGAEAAPAAADTKQDPGTDPRQDSGVFSALARAAKRFGRGANRYGLGHPPAMSAPTATAPVTAPAPPQEPADGTVTAAPPSPASPHATRRLHRGTFAYVLSYEALSQRQYLHDPDLLRRGQPVFVMGNGRWLTHHLMAMVVLNLDTERSTSNAIAGAVEYLDGRNQHGQLVEYDSVRTVAVSFSYYW
ncbi:MAG: hypothetical protein ABJA82_04210 [Myxococcales bacterium]